MARRIAAATAAGSSSVRLIVGIGLDINGLHLSSKEEVATLRRGGERV